MTAEKIDGRPVPRILVVDDDRLSRKVIAYLLINDGYDVVDAGSGAEALDAVKHDKTDLIFLDLNMDDIGGKEVLDALKADDRNKDIPVVFVSGIEDEDVISACLDGGAADFLKKPVMAIALREVVAGLLAPATENKRAAR